MCAINLFMSCAWEVASSSESSVADLGEVTEEPDVLFLSGVFGFASSLIGESIGLSKP